MNMICFFGIILCACAQSLLAKACSHSTNNPIYFNMEKALFAFLPFAAVVAVTSEPSRWFHAETAIFAFFFAVSLCISMYAGYQALKLGPVSLTSLIVSFSLIIPCAYGILFLHEPITFFKSTGFVFLLAAILLTNGKREHNTVPVSKKWAKFTLLTLVSNGLCSCLQKQHQTKYPGLYLNEFMCDSMLFATLIFAAAFVISRRKTVSLLKTKKGIHKFGILSGFANAGVNFLTLALAACSDASALFPLISAGTIVSTSAAGILLFRERLEKRQLAALLAGFAAVVCLKL